MGTEAIDLTPFLNHLNNSRLHVSDIEASAHPSEVLVRSPFGPWDVLSLDTEYKIRRRLCFTYRNPMAGALTVCGRYCIALDFDGWPVVYDRVRDDESPAPIIRLIRAGNADVKAFALSSTGAIAVIGGQTIFMSAGLRTPWNHSCTHTKIRFSANGKWLVAFDLHVASKPSVFDTTSFNRVELPFDADQISLASTEDEDYIIASQSTTETTVFAVTRFLSTECANIRAIDKFGLVLKPGVLATNPRCPFALFHATDGSYIYNCATRVTTALVFKVGPAYFSDDGVYFACFRPFNGNGVAVDHVDVFSTKQLRVPLFTISGAPFIYDTIDSTAVFFQSDFLFVSGGSTHSVQIPSISRKIAQLLTYMMKNPERWHMPTSNTVFSLVNGM